MPVSFQLIQAITTVCRQFRCRPTVRGFAAEPPASPRHISGFLPHDFSPLRFTCFSDSG